MIVDLPLKVKIGDEEYPIRNECDYRVIFDCEKALKDDRLSEYGRIKCALSVFYEKMPPITEEAVKGMFDVISCGIENENQDEPALMDWEHDFNLIAPVISRILGYDIRTPDKRTHYWTLIGAYMDMPGDCLFATIVSIRNKLSKGQKLESHEQEILRNHPKMIQFKKLSEEDNEFLFSAD